MNARVLVVGHHVFIRSQSGAPSSLTGSGGLKGEFPRRLREAPSAAVDAGDGEAVLRVMDTAERLPGRWLAQAYFNW